MVPAAKKRDTILNFSIVYLNYHGTYVRKAAGSVQSIGKGKDDYTTLYELNMKIGDLMDVSIVTNAPANKPTSYVAANAQGEVRP